MLLHRTPPDSGTMAATYAAISHLPSSSGTMTFAATLCSCSDSGTMTSSATWCTHSGSGEISMTDLPPHKLELFEHRYEEKYDLFDDLLYVSWLKHNHPGVLPAESCASTPHSKNVFVTLTYSLSFEMRHDSRCSVTFYTQNPYTHQWLQSHNYYRCGVLPCYYSGNQVTWTSTDCL